MGIGAPSGAAGTVNQESYAPSPFMGPKSEKKKLSYNTPGPGSTSLPLLLTSLPRRPISLPRLLASLPRRLISLLRLLASLPRRLPARPSNSLPLRLARLARRLPGDTTIVGVGGCTCTLGSILLRGSGLPGRTEPRNGGCGLLLQPSMLEERERLLICLWGHAGGIFSEQINK
jgi:hypothetical protein